MQSPYRPLPSEQSPAPARTCPWQYATSSCLSRANDVLVSLVLLLSSLQLLTTLASRDAGSSSFDCILSSGLVSSSGLLVEGAHLRTMFITHTPLHSLDTEVSKGIFS